MSLVERAPGSGRIDAVGVVEPYRYGSLVRHTKRQLMTEQQNRTQNGVGSNSLSTPGFSYFNHQRGSLSGMTFDVSDSSSRHVTGDRASTLRENRSRSMSTDYSNESRSNSPWMTWSKRPSVSSTAPNYHQVFATPSDNSAENSRTFVNNTSSSTAASSAHDTQKTSRFVFGNGLGNLPSSSHVPSPGSKVIDSTSSHSVVRRNVWRHPVLQQHQNADEPSVDNGDRQPAPSSSSSLRKYSSTTSLQLLGSGGAKSPSASMDIRPTESSSVTYVTGRNRQNSVEDRMPSTVSHKMVSLIQNYERGAAADADDNDDGYDNRLVRRQSSTTSSLSWMPPPVYSTTRELSTKNRSSSLMNLSGSVSLTPMATTDFDKDEASGTTVDRQRIALALNQLDQALAGEPYSSLRVSNVSRPSAFPSTSPGQNGAGRKLLTYRQYVAEFQQRRPSDVEDRMWNTPTWTENGNASISSSPPESIYSGSASINNARNANESNSGAISQSKINGGCLEFPFRVSNGSLTTNVDAMKFEKRLSPNWRDSRNPTTNMDRQPSIQEVVEMKSTTQKPPLDTRLQQTVGGSHVAQPEVDAGSTPTAAPSMLPWPTATSWNGPETPQYPPVLLMFRERTSSLKSDCTGDSGFGRSDAYASSTAGDEVDTPNDTLQSPYSAASTSPISATSATFTSSLTARLSPGFSTSSTAATPSRSDWSEGLSAVRHRNQTTSTDSWSAARRRASLNLPIGKQTPMSSVSAARPSFTSAVVNGATSTTPKSSDMRRTSSPACHVYDNDYDNSRDKSPPPTTISIRRFGWRSSSEDVDSVVPPSAQQKRYSFGILPREGTVSPEPALPPSWPSPTSSSNHLGPLSGGDPHYQLQQQQVQLITTSPEIGCQKLSPNQSHDECAKKLSTDSRGGRTLSTGFVERNATSSRVLAETQTQGMAQSVQRQKNDASQEKECGDVEKDSRKEDVKSLVISVEVEKKPLTGIGCSIEGGKGSLNGDRPISVRKLFSDAAGNSSSTECVLQVGDEIISVNGTDMSSMTRHEAWNFLKSLPDGTTALVVVRRIAE